MLLAELMALPTGTRVLGEIGAGINLSGVIQSDATGARFIRWTDGYATVPLGSVRKYDEYIATHTRLKLESVKPAALRPQRSREIAGRVTERTLAGVA